MVLAGIGLGTALLPGLFGRTGALGTISKKPGDSLRCYDKATNVGTVSIHLGVAQVIRGPSNIGWMVRDYGTLSPGASVSVDQMNILPSDLPNGNYTHYLALIDLDTNETLKEAPTGWTVSIQIIKDVNVSGIVLQ